MSRRPLIETAYGTHREAFGLQEWGLLVAVAAIWGSSFLFIEIGLEHFGPGVVAFGRVAVGALTLSLLPGSRRPVQIRQPGTGRGLWCRPVGATRAPAGGIPRWRS